MLLCQFPCHVLKALFFIEIALKLSYFCKKKCKIFEHWGIRPQTLKIAPPIANFWLRARPRLQLERQQRL